MKTIILRKPKFMRNDKWMLGLMETASSCADAASIMQKHDDIEACYEFMSKAGDCLNLAAKAGGFFRTKDFFRWLELQKEHQSN